MGSYPRQQIIEDARFLFRQDVTLITFFKRLACEHLPANHPECHVGRAYAMIIPTNPHVTVNHLRNSQILERGSSACCTCSNIRYSYHSPVSSSQTIQNAIDDLGEKIVLRMGGLLTNSEVVEEAEFRAYPLGVGHPQIPGLVE